MKRPKASSRSRKAAAAPVVVIDGEEDEEADAKKIDSLEIIDIADSQDNAPPPEEAAGEAYYSWCVYWLSVEFPRVTMNCIRQALRAHEKRLGPSYRALQQVHAQATAQGLGSNSSNAAAAATIVDAPWWLSEGLKLNKSARIGKTAPREQCPFFERELSLLKTKYPAIGYGSKAAAASTSSCDIECGCCCVDCPFEKMVQCVDGHLFCFECLKRHVEQAAFGGGQSLTYLPCMDTAGCAEFFPWSEVERALPPDVLSKYEKRLAEESVARAKLEGLVYCPFCGLPCEVDPGLRNLDCPNTACGKSSCIKCKEPNHLPLSCEEIEKESETSLRRRVEEQMTKALIRECSSCKAELVKIDGCNKVRCRCGQVMCYVCRKPIKEDYKHFCPHVREPGKACKLCSSCGLWEVEAADEVVRAAKEAAIKEAVQQAPVLASRKIGPDEQHQQPQPRRKRARHQH